MDPEIAKILANPYASPAEVAEPAPQPAAPVVPQFGSLAIVFPGVLLLLVGYLASNLFALGDIFGLGFGPEGKPIPSPLAGVLTTPGQQWLFYAVAGAAAIVGAVMVGSQNFSPAAAVCYFMCPIAALAMIVGMPLRMAGRFATPIATIYLAIGTCLAGAGVMRLVNLYGQHGLDFEPMQASFMAQGGLALLAGGVLKLWHCGAFSGTEPTAPQGSLSAAGS